MRCVSPAAAAAISAVAFGIGRMSRTDLPRSLATSSGVRSAFRPASVARTRLIGFDVPSDFARMSRMPASSSTARTPAPAMTPVPGLAGFSSTRPAPNTPRISCGTVL